METTTQPAPGDPGVGEDGGERLIQLVTQRGGQDAEAALTVELGDLLAHALAFLRARLGGRRRALVPDRAIQGNAERLCCSRP